MSIAKYNTMAFNSCYGRSNFLSVSKMWKFPSDTQLSSAMWNKQLDMWNSQRPVVTAVGYCWHTTRDVNFPEFYFSIREFQISRLVETRWVLETQRGIGRWSVKESAVALTSPPLTHWELKTVVWRLLRLLARSRPVSRWQVDVPGRVSAVRRQAAATDSS